MSADTISEQTQSYEFKAEMKQLLNLIIHSLYTHPEVFLRELVSNSSDALNKVRFRKLTDTNIIDPDDELRIDIKVDKEEQTIEISDNGIGMTQEDLVSRLGTIASSGTLDFIKNIKKEDGKIDANLIGQFGVGFYSVFMVTEEVTVETRNAENDSQAFRWISSGEDNFTIEEIEKEKRGTSIKFKLKEEYKEFAEDWKINSTIQKYSNFVDFPVYVNDEKVNTVDAIWQRKKDDITDEEYNEFYKFVSGDFSDPSERLHINIEGNINFKAIVYLPENAPPTLLSQENQKSLHLYSNRVFIQDDADLLPDYLRFLKGVVDTEDLPLNVSREVTQNSPVLAKIKNILTKKILDWLTDLANKDSDKYTKFYKNFGPLFKLGSNSDFTNKEKILPLLRFESTNTKNGEFTDLEAYITKAGEEQKEIFYVSGQSRESLERNPNLEYFKKNEIEVLLLIDPSDVFTVPYLGAFKEKLFTPIDKADIKDSKEENEENKIEDEQKGSLIKVFKDTLQDKIEDVIESKRLVDSPVTLVSGKQGLDPQMEKMMKMMDKNFQSSKKILEINLSHPLIKNLSKMNLESGSTVDLRNAIEQLYESAQLLEGELQNPAEFVSRIYSFMEKATEN